MGNYSEYSTDVAESLIDLDNAIDRAEYRIKALERRKSMIVDDPARVAMIEGIIKDKKADLVRLRRERGDVSREPGAALKGP